MGIGSATLQERRSGLEIAPLGDLHLECGKTLRDVRVGYRTYGNPMRRSDAAIYLCHSLSADCHVTTYPESERTGWWHQFVGSGKPIDLDRYFLVCSNFLGSLLNFLN